MKSTIAIAKVIPGAKNRLLVFIELNDSSFGLQFVAGHGLNQIKP
jgi:hypothetical protein